jgi:hypothetical protein
MTISRFLAIFGLILIGICSRLILHPPNFTSLNAIAIFGPLFLGSRWLSFSTVCITLFLSDLTLGFHYTMPFVYLSFGLMIIISDKFKSQDLHRQLLLSLFSSLLFFLVTNLGEWITGSLYPPTLRGLGHCFVAALPFLTYQIMGDLVYGCLLLGSLFYWKSYQSKQIA